jgi:uncharacterized membrane protein YkoI
MSRFLSALAALAVAFAPAVRADDEKPKGQKPAPADAPKIIVIQLDASKLPPDVLKQLMQLAKPGEPSKPSATKPEPSKPAVKPEPSKPAAVKTISLADAIAIAEKASKGTAVKAEREDDDGKVQFEVEVTDAKGGKTEYVIDASGKVLSTETKGKSKPKGDGEEKGNKGNKG